MINERPRIAIVGLGYVGLPLARLFATKFPVVGFDINQSRINELKKGHDSTLEVEDEILQAVLLEQSNPVLKPESELAEILMMFILNLFQDLRNKIILVYMLPVI